MIAINSLKRHNTFYRFLIVGVINTLIGLLIMFTLLTFFGWSYWLSTFIGNSVGATISYFLNRTFTFNSSVTANTGIPKFIIVILLSYFISYTLSAKLSQDLFMLIWTPGFVSQKELAVLGGAFLYTLTNYMGQKTFVFRKLTEEPFD